MLLLQGRLDADNAHSAWLVRHAKHRFRGEFEGMSAGAA